MTLSLVRISENVRCAQVFECALRRGHRRVIVLLHVLFQVDEGRRQIFGSLTQIAALLVALESENGHVEQNQNDVDTAPPVSVEARYAFHLVNLHEVPHSLDQQHA